MTSNAPLRPKWFKRAMFRDPRNDLRPSRFAFLFAAHSGTVVEIVLPLVMLFSHGGTVSFVAVVIIVIFHLHIISNVPLAVPNEWNVYMIAAAIFLFGTHADISVTDLSNPLLIALLAVGVVGPVVLGNLRPDLVSFVVAMRYYAGTWPASLWSSVVSPGAGSARMSRRRPAWPTSSSNASTARTMPSSPGSG